MNSGEQRFLIYASLLLTCSVVGVFLGLLAGVMSFIQVAAVLELLYLLHQPGRAGGTVSKHLD